MHTLYINHVAYALQLPGGSDLEIGILPHLGNSQHEKQHIALIAIYVNIYTLHAAVKRCVTTKYNHSAAVVPVLTKEYSRLRPGHKHCSKSIATGHDTLWY